MDEYHLDELEAFDAMILFLREYARQTNSTDVVELLDEVEYSHIGDSGAPVLLDQGDWEDWLRAVKAVVSHRGKPRPNVVTGIWTPDAREDRPS